MAVGDLTSAAAAKAYLGVSGTTDDALFGTLVTAASQYVQAWLTRTIAATDYTQRFNGPGGHQLVLPHLPINSVASLMIDGVAVPACAVEGGIGYRFDDVAIYLLGYTFTRGLQNVLITWNAGFATTPPDIAQATVELVAIVYRDRDRIGQLSKSLGNGETVSFFSGDLTPRVKTLLNQYKKTTPC